MPHRRTLSVGWLGPLVSASLIALASSPARAGDETYPGDVGQAIAAVVVFVVLLVILAKWAWGPIVQQLRRREEAINSALQKADKREKEAGQLLDTYRARLESVETEAKEMLAKSRGEAEAERDQVLQAAREAAREAAQAAGADIERAKKQALRELQGQTAHLATDIAGRIIREQLTPEQHQEMVAESLEQIRKRVGKDR